jgi:hypothetical protein
VWPAIIFANNRKAREKGRKRYVEISMTKTNGTKNGEIPLGMNKRKKVN